MQETEDAKFHISTKPDKKQSLFIKKGKEVSLKVPKVSIIIPAYNVSAFINVTLNSVFSQTYTDFEAIVVNDGSKDKAQLENALKPFFDKIIYAEQENCGVSAARNSAISLARGEFLAFLDGDDIWFPFFLESQINLLEKENLEMVYCDALMFGESLFEGINYMKNAPSNGAVTTMSLISGDCNVITSGTVLRKNLIEKFGVFDTKFTGMEDFDLWFRFAKNGAKIGYQKKILIKYRVRADNLTGGNVKRSERNIFALKAIREKYELDKNELNALEKHLVLCKAELELEKGKHCLVNNDYANAKSHFTEANKYYRKLKLSIIIWLMQISPKLTLQIFKKLRPAEFSFITPHKS